MSLSISISNDDGTPFLPGSLVLGVVNLVMNDDQPIGEITINFSGRASVLLIHSYGDMTTSRRDYKSVGYLFSQQVSLYGGKYTHRKGSYMWPFAFRVPLSAAPRALPSSSRDYFRPEKPWKSDGGSDRHPLPPTMTYGGPFICSVEYMLRATLKRPQSAPLTLLNRNLSCEKHVKIQRLTRREDLDLDLEMDPGCDPAYLKVQHIIECPIDNLPKPLPGCLCSIWNESRRHFKSIVCPKMRFQLSVWIPQKIVLRKQQNVSLSVLVSATAHPTDLENESAADQIVLATKEQTQPRCLTIKTFKVSLVQHTQVRAGCHRSLSEIRILVRRGSSCSIPLPFSNDTPEQRRGGGISPPMSTSFLNLADVANLQIPTTSLVPDFSTYNIARAHSLDIRFKMEYGNKKFKFHLRRVRLRVLSPECEGGSNIDDVWIVPPPPPADFIVNDEDGDDVVAALFAESPPPPPYVATRPARGPS